MKTNNEKWEKPLEHLIEEELGIDYYHTGNIKDFIRQTISQEKIALIKSLPVEKKSADWKNPAQPHNAYVIEIGYNQKTDELLEWQKEQIEAINEKS
jgi:hypothetical protein